ncbi:MAG: type II toxin-antitoxin system death-on-curing family toxin [Chloroflexota bacterium]|nr:type II toxin-antitoxin system death-on-curing family toxin [Chloroflexota bacterium]
MDLIFLSLDEVLDLHRDQIVRYGGSAGLRDIGLLVSAVEMPKAFFGGRLLHEDPHAMASAYMFHIVQNHPFVDGNKRVGLAAALAFLGLNNLKLVADNDEVANLVLSVAQGQTGKTAIADFLRSKTVPRAHRK